MVRVVSTKGLEDMIPPDQLGDGIDYTKEGESFLPPLRKEKRTAEQVKVKSKNLLKPKKGKSQ